MIHKTTRSILSVLLAVLLLVTSVPLTPAFADGGAVSLQSVSGEGLFAGGTGTAYDPYQIATAEELWEFAELVNGGKTDASAILTANIDLSSVGNWIPIGNEDHPYSGNFNGDGHTISGLYIDSNADEQGLFGYVDPGGTVQNLSVSGSVKGKWYVGGVVGYNNRGTVTGCTFSVSGSVSGGEDVGGVVGYNNGGTVTGCTFSGSGSVSGGEDVGGVVGYNNGGTVTGCTFSGSGSVSGDLYVGGVVGVNSSNVENCYNIGKVTGSADSSNVGGVVGYNYIGGSVKNSYNTGAVSGGEEVGGVVGYNIDSVTNCYNTGTVTGSSDNNVGGVVGYNYIGSVTNCYNTGEVSGNSKVGGVVGNNEDGPVTNCYNTGSVSGTSNYVGGVVGLNDGTNASVANCYFLQQNPVIPGIGNGSGGATSVTTLDELWENFENDPGWSLSENLGRPVLTSNHEDDGSEQHPYEIFTATQLENFRDLVNGANGNPAAWAVLMENIDLEGSEEWTPIGSTSQQYSGNFDGNGKTISGLYIDSSDTDYQGLFGYLGTSGDNKGTVQNLSVSGSVSVSHGENVGGIVGYNFSGTVTNCAFSGSVGGIFSGSYVGGIVGYNSSGTVTNCAFSGSVSGSVSGNYVGGVVGYNNGGTVTGCIFSGSGSVSGGSYVGGVVGWNSSDVNVTNCYNIGSVSGSASYVGGVVGQNLGTVENCYNTGAVSGSGLYVGGVVGDNSGTVENCYNTGTVTGNYVGGVVGQNINGSVTNCYYQNDKASAGIGGSDSETDEAIAKDNTAFHSGEVAWLLQKGQKAAGAGEPIPQVWGQSNLTATTSLPTLVALDKNENAKPVYKVAFISDNTEIEAEYANSGMTVTPPKAPEKTGHLFGGWYDNAELTGDPVTGTISVKGNATYTAKWEPYTYSISVDKSTLDFGSMTEGDTLPAAQTVTITNTGNQSVTVNLPTSTNYTITAGTGFTNGTATLAPDKTATFTIQPKDNLSRGSYSEQIAISNTNGEKATITATFTVKEPPYTGKYSYEVSTSVGDHGSLTVDRYATEGDKVTIDVTPDQAYKLDELVVTANGKDVELTANSDGTYTFTMPSADVKITATFAEDPDWTPDEPEEPTTDVSDIFIDIAPNAWYKDAVQYAYDQGLMTGVSATEFAPEATTTRAMIVSILARLENVTTAEAAGFADVDDEWYATAVNWAANVGVVNGYEDNTFQPNTAITREQLAAILMNYAAYKGEDVSNRADLTSYTDQPSTWAEEAISWSVAEGLLTGVTADTLQPQGAATRAQVAAILQRFLSE